MKIKKLIIANWKTNPDAPGRAARLASEIEKRVRHSKNEVAIAPPAPYLLVVAKKLKKVKLAAQDVSWGDVGASTGEISWHQLKHLKVQYVIIGHSERRRLLGETDEMINKKVLASLKNGLKVVLCVGEPKSVRTKGMAAVKKFLSSQLGKDLKGIKSLVVSSDASVGVPTRASGSLIIAYEPIWAISSVKGSKPDKPEDSVEVIKFIKNVLASRLQITNVRVLYGGSVNAKNALSFLSQKEIDGALVGGASLHPREFIKIVASA